MAHGRKRACESRGVGKETAQSRPLVSGGSRRAGGGGYLICQRAPERRAAKSAGAGPWWHVFACPFTCVIVVDSASFVKQFLETRAVSGGGDWSYCVRSSARWRSSASGPRPTDFPRAFASTTSQAGSRSIKRVRTICACPNCRKTVLTLFHFFKLPQNSSDPFSLGRRSGDRLDVDR